MEALEKYYREYLLGYASDANWEIYDVDMQMTKDHVERILEIGYIEDSEIDFVKSLLPDIESQRIRTFSLLLLVSYIGVITKGAFYEKRK